MLRKIAILVCTILIVIFVGGYQASAQTATTFPSGSAIIDMGSSAPTVKNSLKPYGLVYALLKNNKVPVNYVVNGSKVKDGIDFVHNGKSYKGGTFVISADHITSAVTTVLNTWANQGVIVDYTVSSLTLNVNYKINFVPKWAMDKTNGAFAVGFLTAAGIPSSAYTFKNPSELDDCEDLFVMPHAEPTWATHSNLLDWNNLKKGAIWAGCHAVSMMENLVDPNNGARKMNFLTSGGLLPFTDHTFTSIPFLNHLPGDPVAQYYNKTDNAQLNGSENVYLPKPGSQWNAGAKIITSSPGQADVPTNSPGLAVENIYGRAFNDVNRGYVAYQAAHDIGGTSEDQIAAQRIFFNFSLFALNDKIPPIINASLNGQTTMNSGTAAAFNVTNTGTGTISSIQWTVFPASAGTFSNSSISNPTFTASAVVAPTDIVITCTITGSCGRVSFDSKKFTVIPPPPTPNLTVVDYLNLAINDGCSSASITFNVFTGNPDANSGTRTLLQVTGLGNGTVLTNTNGDITYTPAADFKGTVTGKYQITNGLITSNAANGALSITVGDLNKAPVVGDDALTILVDNLSSEINVLANDQVSVGGGVLGTLTVRDIVTKPTKGYAYINANGTVSYLSTRDQTGGSNDSFQYLACNSQGYCSVGTVNVTLVSDNCAAGQYQTTTLSSTASVSLDPIAAATLDQFVPGTPSTANPAIIRINGGSASGRTVNSAIKFNLSGISTNSVVTAATLSITNVASYTHDVSGLLQVFPAFVYQLTEAFTDGQAGWSNRATGTAWTVAGGTFTTVGAPGTVFGNTLNDGDIIPAGTSIGSDYISSIVQNWISTPGINHGLLVAPDVTVGSDPSDVDFYGPGEAVASRRPKLNVRYISPPACLVINTNTNYNPIAYPDATTTPSNAAVTINVKANDLNYYGNTNTVSAVSTPANGTASINGSNNIVYTPNGTFIGVDEFTYTLKDVTTNATFTGKIRVTVTRVGPTILSDNPSSIASNIAASPTSTTVDVGVNDSDPQTGAGVIGAPIIVTAPVNGVAEVLAGNNIKYTPSVGFVGTDVFTYRRTEAAVDACAVAQSGTATVTVTVTNRPPTAGPGTINTFSCVAGSVKVVNIASDPEGGTLSATIASAPASGTAVANADGTLTYTPSGTFTGLDAFTYTVTDQLGATSTAATVSVSVVNSNPNIAPVAVNDADNTLVNQPVYTNVLVNDSDPNNDVLSVTTAGLAGPISGTISVMPNKLIKYTPNNNFVGTDTYQYRITDTHGGCSASPSLNAIATVTITIKGVPTTLSGTVWNDLDKSAAPGGVTSFVNIKTLTETGTNGSGSLYVYVTDNANKVIDKTPVDIDGTYLLSNTPSLTSNLKLILSIDDIAVNGTLNSGSVPTGYENTTPVTRALPTTTTTDMGPYDWGIYSNPILSPGTIIGSSFVCSASAVPGAFTSTASASGGSITATGYVYQWQQSITSASANFGNIVGATTANYVPSGALTTTTYFRRRVTTNLNSEKFSNVVTITYVANPTVTVTPAVGTIATGSNIGLTATGADSYAWSPATGLSATTTAAVTASPLSTTMYTVTGTISPSGCANTANITVTVINPGTIGSDQANCGTFTPAALTSLTPGSDASGTAVVTYQWQSSVTSTTAGFSNIAAATTAGYTPAGAITLTTYYRRVATSGGVSVNSNVVTAAVNAIPSVSILPTSITIQKGFTSTLTASGATSYAWTPATGLSATNTAAVIASPLATTTYTVTGTSTGCINTADVTVTVIDPGTIGTSQANCGTFTPATLTSTLDASGTAGITYQWQSSVTSASAGFANIAAATASAYTPAAAITTTTYYRRVATGAGKSYNSNVVIATVNTIPVVAITPTSVTIQKGFTTTLVASGATTYAWTPATGLSSAVTATVIAGPASTTTYTVTGTTSGCNNTGNIIVTVIDPGTIGTSQVSCGAFTPATLTSVADASGTGTITYQWQSSTTSATTGFANIAGATATAYTPAAAITTTTYYRRVATGAGKSYNSNVVTATVNALPVIAIAPTSVILVSGLTQTLTASGANTYVWSPATGLSATTTAAVIASPVTTTTFSVVGTITASGCTGTGTIVVTVVSPGTLIPGTIGSPQTICTDATPAAFTSTAASGGLGTINYQWQQSTDNITFTNIVGATAATYGAGALTQTTYYRRGASTANDAVIYTPSVKVTVLQKPVIIGGINGPCAMPKDTIKTFSVTPAVNATSYLWTLPSTGGWSGSSTTNTIAVKAGTTNGTISVTPFNGSCAGAPVTYTVSIIDYAKVTISGTPVTASGNNNNPVKVTIQLIDVLGNLIGCSGGPATLCTNSGTFTTVVDNGDGTYTSFLTSSANDVTICGAVAGVQISQTTKVTFTGPQGGIKSNGPILDFEIPKITFTATAGRAPFTVIYHSAKSPVGKNDTLTNVTSGTAYPVKLIPSTTLYTLVSVIDANNERRDNNFIRDTTTTIVLAPKVIITLKADTPKKEADSTWATRIVVHTKNIGDMDLTNSQARLNLKTVFPAPVTYVLDSVRVTGRTVVPNRNYDGVSNEDLFAKLNKGRRTLYNTATPASTLANEEIAAPDGSAGVEHWNNATTGQEEDMDGLEVVDDGHSIYMFGPQSSLPVNEDATIILWLHVKPNGYTEPFVMQAVALGTGSTEGATALTTSLSNDNEDVNAHPEVTKTGDPLPAVINLFPTAVIGASLSAGTPVLQGNGTYNVTLTYKVKNYGNVNLKNVQLSQDLLRSIGLPSTFNVVGPVTSTGNLIPNPGFNAKSDTNMLLPLNSILGYKQESTLSYVINITPNQLSSVYRLQAIASGYSDDILATVTDISTDGTEPDPDGNNIPSEKIITTIVINLPVPALVPGNISTPAAFCVSATGVTMSETSAPTGGLDAYQYQWQSSTDNVNFFDIIGAESSSYTTGAVTKSTYYRRATISGSQVKYSNAVLLQIYPAPPVPVITGTGSMVVGKGNITLTAPLSAGYAWTTGATTRSIFVQDAGNYGVTITDANGCTAVATAFAITALDPYKVADVQKILSKAPALQADGSFLLSFNILASNLRTELLDSVRLKDDLSKVFPSYATFSIVDIRASGALIANNSYDGKTQTDLLNDVSKLAASKTDSVQITIKLFPNGFAGTLNNVVNLTGRSPFGTVAVVSNDPVNNSNPAVRLPTKFVIPAVDIFIPTGYSPNRDGINDNFVIIRPFNTTISLEIFNRWSNLVYKSVDYKNDWAGKGNQANRVLGEDLPDGTYYYVVLATDKTTGSVRKFAGVVTLKR